MNAFQIALCATGAAALSIDGAAIAGSTGLTVEVQDETVDYPVFFAPVLPGELLVLQVLGPPDRTRARFDVPEGGEAIVGETKLSWKVPEEAGVYPVTVRDAASGEKMLVNVFVMLPMSEVEDGQLNGYRIGDYPDEPLRGLDAYRKPNGFIEVTPENRDTKISPSFTIGQFLCKQETDSREKYVVLRPALIRKLERALDLLEAEGFDASSLFVMSGYRTPFYNRAIGNVRYSRHVYGDAADVYLDVSPRDGDMDDLNRDGKVTKADADYFYDLVSAFDGKQTAAIPRGGLGSYNRNSVHGPFLHIDVRGTPARWGR